MSTSVLSDRLSQFNESATVAISRRLDELRRAGRQIIPLNVGEPDFVTPVYIQRAGIQAISDGFTKYPLTNGISELRTAISRKLAVDNHLNYTVDEICVTNGAKQAICNAILALCSRGDEVIVPTPCWVSYTDIVKLAGAVPVTVPCRSDWSLDLEAIEAAITPKTKAVIICTPNNPTGAVYMEADLRQLGELIVRRDLFVIVDEIYEKLIYDGIKHFSMASISPEVWSRTLTVNGFSKAYAMTGWRVGYVAARRDIIRAVMRIQSQTTSGVCSIAQKAACTALTGPQDDLNQMVRSFERRRDYVYRRICGHSHLSCTQPHGAFYLLVDISFYLGKHCGDRVIQNGTDFAAFLLDEALVAVVPGEAFHAPNTVRISYSNSLENLEKAMDQIESALSRLD